jgi:hypothetical protein
MTDPGTSGRPPLHAELVRQEAELARVRVALVWAERAGEPRRAAALRREAGRLRRRIARLRGLLGLPPRDEEG